VEWGDFAEAHRTIIGGRPVQRPQEEVVLNVDEVKAIQQQAAAAVNRSEVQDDNRSAVGDCATTGRAWMWTICRRYRR
jgi:hypothetical protein